MKENDYYNTHRNVFVWEQNQISQGGNHPPTPNFDSLPYVFPYPRVWEYFLKIYFSFIYSFYSKMTG